MVNYTRQEVERMTLADKLQVMHDSLQGEQYTGVQVMDMLGKVFGRDKVREAETLAATSPSPTPDTLTSVVQALGKVVKEEGINHDF